MEFIQTVENDNPVLILNIDDLYTKDLDTDVTSKLDQLKPLLKFQMSTYNKLKKVNEEDINLIYGIVNQFLNTLDFHDKLIIASTFANMHYMINDFFCKDDLPKLSAFIKELDKIFDDMDQQTDICGKLKTYVIGNVSIGLYEGAGTRAQDSQELTFYSEDVVDVTTLCILCKLMSPIFGVLMKLLMKRIDNNLREMHCFYIFTSLLNRRYFDLYHKLDNYVHHATEQQIKKASLTMLVNGYDIPMMSHRILSELFTRQFVNCNLLVKNGNLMVYIIVSVKRSISTILSSINKIPTNNRISTDNKHDEYGNTAQLEIDSVVSRKMTDSLPLVRLATKQAIKRNMQLYQIEQEAFDASYAYYKTATIVPNTINRDLGALFYSRDLGGGKSLDLLKAVEFHKLITLLQLITVQMDAGYAELAHALTALPALDVSVTTSVEEGKVKLNAGSSEAYRACKAKYEQSKFAQKSAKEWDCYMSSLVDEMLTKSWVYNTSPFVYDFLGMPNMNGKIFQPSSTTFAGLCAFYLDIWELLDVNASKDNINLQNNIAI